MRELSKQELLELISNHFSHISPNDRDEMAIPSYIHRNPLIRWLMWKRYEHISELANFTKNMNVLEFGCGIGIFLPELNRMCGKVYAIDIFPEYAKLLSVKLNLNINFIYNLSEIADNSMDLVIAADVFEHIDDLSDYLMKFSNKLKNDGRLIVSGPTENVLYKIGRIVAGFCNKGDYHHRNIDEIIKMITEAGFSLINQRKLPFVIPPHLFKICEFRNA